LQQTYANDYPKQLGWSLRLEPAQTSAAKSTDRKSELQRNS
jgi:hypothetical protein